MHVNMKYLQIKLYFVCQAATCSRYSKSQAQYEKMATHVTQKTTELTQIIAKLEKVAKSS